MRRTIFALFAALPLAACFSIKDGVARVSPLASGEEVDAVATHLTEETKALRAEAGVLEARVRKDMNDADEKIRADAIAQANTAQLAMSKALADGKTMQEALEAKWRAQVDAAERHAAEAIAAAGTATTKATAAQDATVAAAAERGTQFTQLLEATRAGRLDAGVIAKLNEKLGAPTPAPAGTTTLQDVAVPVGSAATALLLALLENGRRKRKADKAKANAKPTEPMGPAPRT